MNNELYYNSNITTKLLNMIDKITKITAPSTEKRRN